MATTDVIANTVLAGVLAASALFLNEQASGLRTQANFERSLQRSNQELSAISTTGIDATGRVMFEVLPPDARRFVLFGLHRSTLEADLLFWRSVGDLLASQSGVYLIGYCDSSVCAEDARNSHRSAGFSVIAYGEPATVQAVLNADAEGAALVGDGKMMPLRRAPWRGRSASPANVVLDVLR